MEDQPNLSNEHENDPSQARSKDHKDKPEPATWTLLPHAVLTKEQICFQIRGYEGNPPLHTVEISASDNLWNYTLKLPADVQSVMTGRASRAFQALCVGGSIPVHGLRQSNKEMSSDGAWQRSVRH